MNAKPPILAAKYSHLCAMCYPHFCSMKISQDVCVYAGQARQIQSERVPRVESNVC